LIFDFPLLDVMCTLQMQQLLLIWYTGMRY